MRQGQIVTYVCTKDEKEKLNNQQDTAPAVVVTLWGEAPGAAANLRVLFDGPEVGWKTSATGYSEPTEHGGHYLIPAE